MFDCHCLIYELVPDQEVPGDVDRRFNEIIFELSESGETGGEMKTD